MRAASELTNCGAIEKKIPEKGDENTLVVYEINPHSMPSLKKSPQERGRKHSIEFFVIFFASLLKKSPQERGRKP